MNRYLLAATLSATVLCGLHARAQDGERGSQNATIDSALANPKVGLSVNKPQAMAGYVLVAPMNSTSTYLIDNESRVVNEWKSDYTPALSAYLLPNGHLLRPGAERRFPGGGPGRPAEPGGPDRPDGPDGDRRGPEAPGEPDRPDGDRQGPGAADGFGPGGFRPGGPGGIAPGAGGRIQEFDWDGTLVWDFSFTETFRDTKYSRLRPHHDICPLPNGNVLVVCTDPHTKEESIEAGRLPTIAPETLQADAILEIKPAGRDGGEVVWEWYAWDHLIQEVHKEKRNYGDVSEHPELVDINFTSGMMDRMMQDPEQLARLRSLGYVGGGTAAPPPGAAPDGAGGRDGQNPPTDGDSRGSGRGGPGRGGPGDGGDWMHVNSVAYNPRLDQIMISVHEFSEVWILDHSTTTDEAASHSGGKSGKGGDLLYRWGNPRAYRSGTNTDQQLFAQHCAHWIADGLPGAGNMLVFNNGGNRPDGTYSSADEVVLPLADDGTYEKEEYVAFEPFQAEWRFGSKDTPEFFSMLISGCQRLPNGNTFICSGTQAVLFEVTPDGDVVWVYKHPGAGFGFGPGGPGSMFRGLVPGFLAGMLGVDEDQQAKIKALQDDVDMKLKDLLSESQFRQLNADNGFPGPPGFGPPGGFGPPDGAGPPDGQSPDGRGRRGQGRGGRGRGGFPAPPRVGEVLTEARQKELELTDEQTAKLAEIQKDVTARLDAILTDVQRKQISDMENMFAGGGGPGFAPPGFGPPGGGGRGFGPPGGFGGPPPGFGPPGAGGDNGGGPGRGFGGPGRRGPGGPGGPGGIFRAYKYAADYTGLQGRDLTPGKKLNEQVEQ
ncbi:MAG: aryl-sulfate sulfotransferase [Planctomycetaceae bacterium]